MKGLEDERGVVTSSVFYDVNSARKVKGGLEMKNRREGVHLTIAFAKQSKACY